MRFRGCHPHHHTCLHTWTSLSFPLTKDDLWCSVVASGDNSTMVFMVKGGTAKVYHPHSCALHASLISLLGTKQEKNEPLHYSLRCHYYPLKWF